MSHAAYVQQSPIASAPHHEAMAGRSGPDLYPVDLTTWDDGAWAHPFFSQSAPEELDEPWPYRFRSGQCAWICASDGEWYHAKIVSRPKRGMTRSDEGLYWCAEFLMGGCKVRKWCAPLNGEIKPDIEHTQQLLFEAGWLESDSDE